MASKKESPRQKMIGMMYLVLTAMLALNVQREVLDAFVTLDEGNARSLQAYSASNDALFGQLKFANNVDPGKASSYFESAAQIRSESTALLGWIEALRKQLVQEEEGISPEEADTLRLRFTEKLDKYDASTRILIGPKDDASEGAARELRERLEAFMAQTNATLDGSAVAPVESPFDFSDRELDGELEDWETFTFYDTPLAACVAMLHKTAADVRAVEYAALNGLLAQISVDDIPVDTVLARVIPTSNYVTLGEAYQADIFLGAYSTTSEPQVLIGEVDESGYLIGEGTPLEVADGIGQFEVKPGREGLHSYAGEVRITDKQGKVRRYPFRQEYLAAKPTAVVSPTAMNVMYIGPDNPLDVSVPGIPDEHLVVSITGGNSVSKVGAGKYVAKLKPSTDRNIQVNVSARLSDGSVRSFGSLDFRARPLPDPKVRISDIYQDGRLTLAELKAFGGIKAEYDKNFEFAGLPLHVVRFKISYVKDGQLRERAVNGRRMSSDIKAWLDGARRNTEIKFFDIMVEDVNGKVTKANSIYVKLN